MIEICINDVWISQLADNLQNIKKKKEEEKQWPMPLLGRYCLNLFVTFYPHGGSASHPTTHFPGNTNFKKRKYNCPSNQNLKFHMKVCGESRLILRFIKGKISVDKNRISVLPLALGRKTKHSKLPKVPINES